MAASPTAEELIEQLGLVPHPEGGFFRETYRAGAPPMQSQGLTDPKGYTSTVSVPDPTASGPSSSTEVPRNSLTSIFYMLTAAQPLQVFVHNKSDTVHYWQCGGRMEYILLSESGRLERQVLGPRLQEGDVMQLSVSRLVYKSARLIEGEFVLLGEAVAPGFDYRDHSFVTVQQLEARLGAELTPDLAALTKLAVTAAAER